MKRTIGIGIALTVAMTAGTLAYFTKDGESGESIAWFMLALYAVTDLVVGHDA